MKDKPPAYYQIIIPRSVEKTIKSLPKRDILHILTKLEQLASSSINLNIKKLAGYGHIYRMRHGSYRIIYEIYESKLIIHVLCIGHRREVYQQLKRLFGK